MKVLLQKILKVLISGVITFVVLTLFCSIYYNIPIHKTNKDGDTDYVWQENFNYIQMNEGISFGSTNNKGYSNIFDYEENNEIDILIMGSSHTEARNVNINESYASLLNDKIGNNKVYNIGTSGHNIKVCISNLDKALNKYKPKIVIIETDKICLTDNEINNVLNNNIDEISSSDNKIINFLQKNPFLRTMYHQIQNFNNQANEESNNTNKTNFDETKTNELIKYVKNIANKYETKVIIMYHPTVSLNEDGTMSTNVNLDDSNSFKEICLQNDIYYLDMSNRYLKEYEENNIVPTGFINTAVGVGHINKYAHQMMYDELYKIIKEIY